MIHKYMVNSILTSAQLMLPTPQRMMLGHTIRHLSLWVAMYNKALRMPLRPKFKTL